MVKHENTLLSEGKIPTYRGSCSSMEANPISVNIMESGARGYGGNPLVAGSEMRARLHTFPNVDDIKLVRFEQ